MRRLGYAIAKSGGREFLAVSKAATCNGDQAKCPAVAPLATWCCAVGHLLKQLRGLSESSDAEAVASTLCGPHETGTSSAAAGGHVAAVARHSVERGSGPQRGEQASPSGRAPAGGGPLRPQRTVSGRAGGARVKDAARATLGAGEVGGAPAALGGYTVEPELWSLSEVELSRVRNLRVGREGIGHVTFHGLTDCRGLLEQLPEILIIKQGEVVVYPDVRKKPPTGQGLNKSASIVLYGCMPKIQTRLSSPRARGRYKRRVAQMTEEKGAVFEDYDCDDGTWSFRVHHF
mmetsp:Transcript_48320/g.112009  ORF Transcript_48320/g.112009 Transcript_48320/m.112009 type:complete len:289 (+) Transcript_48320:177-1043(+)